MGSISDYLKQKMLGFSVEKNQEGKLVAVSDTSSLEFRLTTNEFPYMLREGLSHAVFWCQTPWDLEKARGKVTELLGSCDFAIWTNPPERRSVPGLWHAQVIYQGTP